jgi:hypothetical protein
MLKKQHPSDLTLAEPPNRALPPELLTDVSEIEVDVLDVEEDDVI